jgi:hypothetical protein
MAAIVLAKLRQTLTVGAGPERVCSYSFGVACMAFAEKCQILTGAVFISRIIAFFVGHPLHFRPQYPTCKPLQHKRTVEDSVLGVNGLGVPSADSCIAPEQ